MAYPISWNPILVPSSETWRLVGRSRSGGQTMEGNEQVVVSPTSRWMASLTIPCMTRDKVLAARALLAALDGRAGTVLVGPCEITRAPLNLEALTGERIGPFDGIPGNPDADPALTFALGGGASLNDTVLTIARIRGGALIPGMYLSLGDRMHVIAAGGDDGAASSVQVAVRPWLRADYGAGTPVEFLRPTCLMRLATDDTGALDLQLSRFGTLTLDLVEAF